MAGQAAKKVAKNAQTKSVYFAGSACVTTFWNLAHSFFVAADYSFFGIIKALFLVFVAWLSYKMIIGALNLGVGYELWLDLFIINSAVQILSTWSSYAWFIYLAVPGYGLYHVGGYIKAWIFARRDDPGVTESDTKATKQKIKYRR